MKEVYIIFGRQHRGGLWSQEYACLEGGNYIFTKEEAMDYIERAIKLNQEAKTLIDEPIKYFYRIEKYYTL